MAVAQRMLPDLSGLDADALRALILSQQEELASRDTEIENLKLLVLKLKRMQFGRKSEKLDKQIERVFSEAGETIKRTSSGRELMSQLGVFFQ